MNLRELIENQANKYKDKIFLYWKDKHLNTCPASSDRFFVFKSYVSYNNVKQELSSQDQITHCVLSSMPLGHCKIKHETLV